MASCHNGNAPSDMSSVASSTSGSSSTAMTTYTSETTDLPSQETSQDTTPKEFGSVKQPETQPAGAESALDPVGGEDKRTTTSDPQAPTQSRASILVEIAKDDHTDLATVAQEAQLDYWGPSTRASLAERRENSKRRMFQTQAYVELIEDRLVELENKVRKMLNESEPRKTEAVSDIPSNLLTIAELPWSEFGKRAVVDPVVTPAMWKHLPELDSGPKSVVEILMEEPRFDMGRVTNKDNFEPGNIEQPQSPQTDLQERVEPAPTVVNPRKSLIPYRIRVRSVLLLKILNEITGLNTTIGPHKHLLVLFKPFKLLIAYGGQLQEHLKLLDSRATGI